MVKTIHQTLKKLRLHSSVYALASCLAISGMAFEAHAAGLGKISVFSSLGQPLRAEIEVKADREELSSMRAQLAPPDQFKQAGLDYASTLLGIKFSLGQRKDGQHIIKLTSDLPINDPFIDLLLELNWASGRLVREYTFLLDPVELPPADPLPVVYAKTAKPVVAEAAPAVQAPDKSEKTEVIRITPKEPTKKPATTMQKAPAAPAQKGESREVRQGDTLFRIASEMKPADVSLEQMLIGLYEANKDAFLGNNINRLKAGRVLTMPDRAALDAIKPDQARRTVSAQAADWNAYRNRLAAAATSGKVEQESGSQASAGKVSAQVGEKTAPVAANNDKLVIAAATGTGKGGKAGSGKAGSANEADRVANQKTIDDAQKRISDLEKIVQDLESLTKIQAEALAKAQKDAETTGKPSTGAAPVSAPAGGQTPSPAEPKVETAPASQSQATPPVVAPVTPPAAADTGTKTEPPPPPPPVKEPRPRKKQVPPPPPPPEEKGLVEEIIDGVMDNIAIIGGALAGILLLVFGMITMRKRRAMKAALQELPSTPAEDFSNLMVNSVFHSTGGQSVDTSSRGAPRTDFSQAGPGTIDTDEVDPVAEADVYMAYGRDVQAEEILLEARQKDPKRTAIILKLLEIYQGRKDARQFESLASELYSDTGGSGPDWEKALVMGRSLVPDNPMFGASGASISNEVSSAPVAAAPVSATKGSLPNSTITMPGALAQMADMAGDTSVSATPAPVPNQDTAGESDLVSLDFDLGFDTTDEPVAKKDIQMPAFEAPSFEPALDFELAGTASDTPSPDFGLDFDASETLVAKTDNIDLGAERNKTDMDLALDTLTFAQPMSAPEGLHDLNSGADDEFLNMAAMADTSIKEAPNFDMSSINLDLDDAQANDLDLSEATQMFDINTLKKDRDALSESEQIANSMGSSEHDLLPEQDYMSMTSISGRAFDQQPPEADMHADLGVDLGDAVSTKIDLAKAYEDMGDMEGARELLQEVINEGTPAQKEKAQEILAKMSK